MIKEFDSFDLELEELFKAKNGVYVVRIRGDSMIDAHLCDGDLVVVERQSKAKDGDQVVALLSDGEATLRRFYVEGDQVRLKAANGNGSRYPDKVHPAADVKIQGVVIGILRSYR